MISTSGEEWQANLSCWLGGHGERQDCCLTTDVPSEHLYNFPSYWPSHLHPRLMDIMFPWLLTLPPHCSYLMGAMFTASPRSPGCFFDVGWHGICDCYFFTPFKVHKKLIMSHTPKLQAHLPPHCTGTLTSPRGIYFCALWTAYPPSSAPTPPPSLTHHICPPSHKAHILPNFCYSLPLVKTDDEVHRCSQSLQTLPLRICIYDYFKGQWEGVWDMLLPWVAAKALNLEPSALKEFKSIVRRDFKGPGSYPAHYNIPTPTSGPFVHPKLSTSNIPTAIPSVVGSVYVYNPFKVGHAHLI